MESAGSARSPVLWVPDIARRPAISSIAVTVHEEVHVWVDGSSDREHSTDVLGLRLLELEDEFATDMTKTRPFDFTLDAGVFNEYQWLNTTGD